MAHRFPGMLLQVAISRAKVWSPIRRTTTRRTLPSGESHPDLLSSMLRTNQTEVKAVVDPNFYGVVNVTRAALPIMRKQRSGVVLQISSLGGRLALPGSAAYHTAKWAVGGFTESLAQEVAPFGVKVCALEPGGMRTNWGVAARQ